MAALSSVIAYGDNAEGLVLRYSLLAGETHEFGDLVLTIEFDVDRGSWIIGLTSPPLWAMSLNWPHSERVYSQVMMPLAAYENDETYDYLACLLAIHFERLGLLYTGVIALIALQSYGIRRPWPASPFANLMTS